MQIKKMETFLSDKMLFKKVKKERRSLKGQWIFTSIFPWKKEPTKSTDF
jgi:hypothetical protein